MLHSASCDAGVKGVLLWYMLFAEKKQNLLYTREVGRCPNGIHVVNKHKVRRNRQNNSMLGRGHRQGRQSYAGRTEQAASGVKQYSEYTAGFARHVSGTCERCVTPRQYVWPPLRGENSARTDWPGTRISPRPTLQVSNPSQPINPSINQPTNQQVK